MAQNRFQTREEAEYEVFAFIEGWHNTQRLHSSLGYLSALEFDKRHFAQQYDLCGLAPPAQNPASRGKWEIEFGLPICPLKWVNLTGRGSD